MAMDVYMFQAALYCDQCGLAILGDCESAGVEDDGDSDTFPQGPYPDGGGEADCPQHCGNCRCFLENPLTTDGAEYVKQAVQEYHDRRSGDADVIAEWSSFYGIDADEPEDCEA